MPAERPIDEREVERSLLSAQLDKLTRQQAWAAFFGSETQDEFSEQFRGLPVPRETFQQLWKLRWGQPPEAGLLFAPKPGTRPATPMLRGEERTFVPPTGREIARFSIEALPFITSGAATLAALPGGPVTGGIASGLGTVPGEALKQELMERFGFEPKMTADEAAAALSETASLYAVGEVLPRAGIGLLTRHAAGPMRSGALKPSAAVPMETSERFGLGLTPGQVTGSSLARSAEFIAETSLLGKPTVEATRRRGLKHAVDAVDETIRRLAQPSSELTVGGYAQDAIRTGKRVFDEYGTVLRQRYDALKGVEVDLTPLIQDAIGDRVTQELLEAAFRDIGAPTPKVKQITAGIGSARPTVSFDMAGQLRTKLNRVGFDPTELTPGEAQAVGRKYSAMLTQQMKAAGQASNPAAKAAWEEYNAFYRVGHDVFERSLVHRLWATQPEKLVRAIREPTDARMVKEAIYGYASRYGTATERQVAAETWREVQAQYARTALLKDPDAVGVEVMDVYNLKNRLVKAGKETLKTMFGGDPLGGEVLDNLTRIGEAMSRVKETLPFTRTYQMAEIMRVAANLMVGPYRGIFTGAAVGGMTGSAGAGLATASGMEIIPYLLSKLMYTRAGTNYALNGIAAFAKRSPEIPAAWRPAWGRNLQQITDAANTYAPEAFGLFGRAFVTALREEEAMAAEREAQMLRTGEGRPKAIRARSIIPRAQTYLGLGGTYEPLPPVPEVENEYSTGRRK